MKGFLREKKREVWILHRSDSQQCESMGQDGAVPGTGRRPRVEETKKPSSKSESFWKLEVFQVLSMEGTNHGRQVQRSSSTLPERGITVPRKGHPHHGWDQRDSAGWDESWDQRKIPGLLDRHLHREPDSRNSYFFVLVAWDSSLVSIITSSRALVHINHLKTYGTSNDCSILVSFSYCRIVKKEPEDSHIIISIKPWTVKNQWFVTHCLEILHTNTPFEEHHLSGLMSLTSSEGIKLM